MKRLIATFAILASLTSGATADAKLDSILDGLYIIEGVLQIEKQCGIELSNPMEVQARYEYLLGVNKYAKLTGTSKIQMMLIRKTITDDVKRKFIADKKSSCEEAKYILNLMSQN